MKNNKLVLTSILALGLSSLSVMAQAGGLTIVNNSNADSTSRINGGLCSTIFGSEGVTKAHTTHVISDTLISVACTINSTNCKADIYMTNNCSGPVIATAIFDVNSGMKSITSNSGQYSFSNGAFDITINENA